ncbi:hypothetical protein [Cohnella endophytica]|uniref:hypothetical protein n=1 Tax=Cohnella endophytica TaxID=2419778 RepID=UPI0011C482B6|nr:hypothetical protein [Cohnella endophytica]
MIRYGDEQWNELKFTGFRYEAEKRDAQWIDLLMQPELADNTPVPPDLIEFSIMAVCTHEGHPIQFVTLDEGIDCEYQLTEWEQDQLRAFIRTEEVSKAILAAAAESVGS